MKPYKIILVALILLSFTGTSMAAVTYTPLEGYIKIGDVVSDRDTMSGKCLQTNAAQVKIDDIVYFRRGNEVILRIDGTEMVFVNEEDVVAVKNE